MSEDSFCRHCGNKLFPETSFCPKCGKSINAEQNVPDNTNKAIKTVSKLWYLAPILLGIIGGLIAYFVLRNDDKKLAKNCLWLSIILTIAAFVIGLIFGIIYAIYDASRPL